MIAYKPNLKSFDKIRLLTTSRHYHHGKKSDYMFMQHSKIPTMHFQQSLPRLPIPKLELTCERYLAAQKPLLIDEYYRKTEANVIRFRDGIGSDLQKLLKESDKTNKHTSYISEAWFDMYLKLRKPLPLNFNPMLVFQNDTKTEYNNQLIRSANLVISSMRFYKSLKAGILEPEVFHLNPKKSDNKTFRTVCSMIPSAFSWYAAYLFNAYPLDMSQYKSLFNSTRIPEIDKDRFYSNPDARHICVQHKGHFYTFDVLDQAGDILEPEVILARLQYILKDNVEPCANPIGVLSTLERNKWATIRHNLTELGNEQSFKLIDGALFNLCLDDDVVGTDLDKMVRLFLHGDGNNRWFDKSFSLQLSKDGFAGVNFEHAWGDGVAVLRYFQDVHKDATHKPRVHLDTKPANEDGSAVRRLVINVNEGIKNEISTAQKNYNQLCKSIDINTIELHGVGRKNCKKFNISPDALMQMSFQVAYYKLHGKFVPSYESCSTAAFKHGRTETIRPCTTATKALSEAITSKTRPSNAELKNLIHECSKVHTQLTREAAMGQGFDRHLYALELLAHKMDKNQENIFSDPAYNNLQNNIISTSTLSSPAVRAGGFGPVVDDGLGLGYVIKDEYIGTLLTTYPKQNGKEFVACLQESINDLMKILHTR